MPRPFGICFVILAPETTFRRVRAKILNASAGSGKTYQLAYKYVHDTVEQPTRYRHILAVTFTNKATEEMKTRILKEIHALASGAASSYLGPLCDELGMDAETVRRRAREVRSHILHDYSHFTVLTIDTFFQRIMRAFIKELGIDLNYTVEIETAPVLAQGADALIEQIAADRELQRWMGEFVQERIDEGLKWDIRESILTLGAELFKERNRETLAAARPREELRRIVQRMSAEAARSREELRRTAAEAVGIIAAAGCTVADFPYREKGFAAWFYAVAGGSTDRYGSRVEAACTDDARWGKTGTPSQRLRQQLQPLLRRLCELYDSNVRLWNTCGLLRENYRSFALLSDLYTRVQQLCDEQNTMLLSETKYVLSEFIGHNDAPFIYEKVGNRFDRFMIDEFQDTSVKEWENFLPLLRNAMAQAAPDETAVLLVGDIKQSIYRWRGGDWRLLHGAAREALGAADTQVVALQENYRSLPVVVEFNNRIIGRIVRSDNDELNRSLAEAAARGDLPPQTAAELTDTLSEAYRNHAQQPRLTGTHPGYVSVETFDERPPVVERICELLDRGFRPGQIMILVRGATDGAKVAAELLEFKRRNTEERYRFDVMTQEALVVGNAPVASFIAAALRLALNPDDTLHRAVYNHYLGRAFDRPLDDEERTFFRSIRLLSPEEAFERIVMRHDIAGDRRQTAYLQAVHEQIIAFCSSKIADIPLWLQWWDETGSGRSLSVEASASAVEITTIHKAKGLEKSVVLIPYCSWQLDPKTNGVSNIVWAAARGDGSDAGCVPVRFRQSMAESGFSEEYYREKVYAHVDNINLLYVALTRARESLHVFLPQRSARTVGGLLRQSIPTEGGRALLDGLEGRCSSTERGERFEFGEFTGPEPPKKEQAARTEHAVLEHYPTSQADLRLRLPSQRYFEEEDEAELSPRNFGILMHRAFEHADDEEQIRRAVERMTADGTLSEAEAPVLRAAIARALEHPVVREWFGGGWQRVRNEHEIVIPAGNGPGNRTIRRPDRVMTAGRRAVVVDYKFGLREKESHRRQIGEYCDLLRQMGYTDVAGYLWYVKRGNIEKVTDEA